MLMYKIIFVVMVIKNILHEQKQSDLLIFLKIFIANFTFWVIFSIDESSCLLLSPPSGKLSSLPLPSHSGSGIPVNLTCEVHSLFLHHHLVHGPPYQHRALCGSHRSVNMGQFFSSCLKHDGHKQFELTVHHQLCRIAVPLTNHVGAHTHIHASVTLFGVIDHQLASLQLKENRVSTRCRFKLLAQKLKFKSSFAVYYICRLHIV